MKNVITDNENMVSTISIEIYESICEKALNYMLSFQSEDPGIQLNFNVKREHTYRVIEYAEVIAKSLECEADLLVKAQLAALLHDIGRFLQYQEHQTFNDAISVDHAELGVQVIEEKQWLNILPDDFQQEIKRTIALHNKISISKNETKEVTLLAKIIRDADKIDILDMSIVEYSLPINQQNHSFTLDLDTSPTVSKSVAKALLSNKLPNREELKTVTDFKLMQMAFVYDLNFKKSFSIINKKQFLKQLFDLLPKSDQVFDIYRKTKIHLENHLI